MTQNLPGGAVRTTSLNARHRLDTRAMPQLVRGVVVAVYPAFTDGLTGLTYAEDRNPAFSQVADTAGPSAVYCDALLYGRLPLVKDHYLKRILVTNTRGGLHDGHVWIPRPAQINLKTGMRIVAGPDNSISKGENIADLDGDHILIGFIDNDYTLPVLIQGIPHPRGAIGDELAPAGVQNRVTVNDLNEFGGPDFWRHHGSFYGLDPSGNFIVDARLANRGQRGPAGELVFAEDSMPYGDVRLYARHGSVLQFSNNTADLLFTRDASSITTVSPNGNTRRWTCSADDRMQLLLTTSENLSTGLEVEDNGDLWIGAGRSVGPVPTFTRDILLQGQHTTFETNGTHTARVTEDCVLDVDGAVSIGTGAAEHLVLGDTFKAISDQYVTAVDAAVLAFSLATTAAGLAASGALSAPLITPPQIAAATAAYVAAMSAAASALTASITTAKNAYVAADYLSDQVTTK